MTDISILHVDDNDDDLLLVRKNIEMRADDLSVEGVASAPEALKRIARCCYDCIVSDYQMSGMSGLQMLQNLRKWGNEIPVIFLTGQGSEDVAADAFRFGADDYFIKGIDPAEFDKLVFSIRRTVRTRRRLIEKKRIEERLRMLFEGIRSGVVFLEPVSGGEDFIISDINRAVETIENVERAGVVGRSILDVFPGVRELGLFDVLKQVYGSGEERHHPTAFYQDDRLQGWRENSVYKLPSGEMVAIYDDATRRMQLEKSRREITERCRIIAECAGDLMFVVSPEGTILEASQAAVQLLGYSDEGLCGRLCGELLAPDQEFDSVQHFQNLREKGSLGDKAIFVTREGLEIPVELQCHSLVYQGQYAVLCIARDVTAEVRKNREIERRSVVFEAVRRIPRIAGESKDRESFLQAICDHFIDVGAYRSVQVANTDGDGRVVLQRGRVADGEDGVPGCLPADSSLACLEEVLNVDGQPVAEDIMVGGGGEEDERKLQCRSVMCARLDHEGARYGALVVTLGPGGGAEWEVERLLLKATADDVAFALSTIVDAVCKERIEV